MPRILRAFDDYLARGANPHLRTAADYATSSIPAAVGLAELVTALWTIVHYAN